MAIETAIVKAGAIPVTVQAMRQHPFVQKVQQYAFELLAYLTVQNLRNQFLVAIVGAIPVIKEFDKMDLYLKSKKLVVASCVPTISTTKISSPKRVLSPASLKPCDDIQKS